MRLKGNHTDNDRHPLFVVIPLLNCILSSRDRTTKSLNANWNSNCSPVQFLFGSLLGCDHPDEPDSRRTWKQDRGGDLLAPCGWNQWPFIPHLWIGGDGQWMRHMSNITWFISTAWNPQLHPDWPPASPHHTIPSHACLFIPFSFQELPQSGSPHSPIKNKCNPISRISQIWR